MLTVNSEKHKYVCGSANPDKFKEMSRIVYHYAHSTPKHYTKKFQHGKIYHALEVMLTKDEEMTVRQEISWIGVPESCRRRLR